MGGDVDRKHALASVLVGAAQVAFHSFHDLLRSRQQRQVGGPAAASRKAKRTDAQKKRALTDLFLDRLLAELHRDLSVEAEVPGKDREVRLAAVHAVLLRLEEEMRLHFRMQQVEAKLLNHLDKPAPRQECLGTKKEGSHY
jgi:hypothetical protein